MNIKKIVETQEILWQSMRETGYCREYIMGYSHELRWIEANAEKFDVSPYFENIIDLYTEYARDIIHSENTISKCKYKASCLFFHLQELGYKTLDNVLEKDVLSFFASEDGTNIRSRSYKRDIGLLLFFTGIRAGDIADLRLNEIDWQNDLIVRRQQKTGNSLDLPLIAVVGNAIYDYISNDRPNVKNDHVFLWNSPPYAELGSDAIWQICEKIYSAAGVRRSPGERRGSHIFRHHLATHLAGKGFAQPVISNTLGHSEPTTLSYYLSADMVHLRELALSIEQFPLGKEVFKR